MFGKAFRWLAAIGWTYRNWRMVLLALHIGVVSILTLLAIAAWRARPGIFATLIFATTSLLAAALAARLPATMRLRRRARRPGAGQRL